MRCEKETQKENNKFAQRQQAYHSVTFVQVCYPEKYSFFITQLLIQ